MQRRRFLQLSAAAIGIYPLLNSCKNETEIAGSIVGASAKIGHMLRDKNIAGRPANIIKKDVVIVGGGISGLSAARWLQKNGMNDFVVLDLEKNMGGNSAFSQNSISAYPWGAHYITVPNNNLKDYLSFLEECNVITGYNTEGLPVINDYYLCIDPQERLYINGQWQDGLIPQFGVPEKDRKVLRLFLESMDAFKYAKGSDGRDAFTIPVDQSSKDLQYTMLDSLTMKEWLVQQQFTSEYLHWYVNYCTRDDFGTSYDIISAWVGIHYFAARKGKAVNANSHDVITWPEGNGWLSKQLQKDIKRNLFNDAVVLNVVHQNDTVSVTYYNVNTQKLHLIEAKQCILATPQFVNNRLLNLPGTRTALVKEHLHYAPWMVANLLVENLIERNGPPLSWDNVFYDSQSLGYVNANQQLLQQDNHIRNLTYYLPLTKDAPDVARAKAQQLQHKDWVNQIIEDLRIVHPNIKASTKKIDIMVWGHAMAQPLPGLVHGDVRQRLQISIDNKIHFAHTDLAGISIFEEAFYQGIAAAKKVITQVN